MNMEFMNRILIDTYAANSQSIRFWNAHGLQSLPVRLKIPVLSGGVGIGKTACAKAFSSDIGFNFINMDCSYEPSNNFAARIHMGITEIENGESKGTVILIDDIPSVKGSWLTILNQYVNGKFDFTVDLFDPETRQMISRLNQRSRVPEGLFIVGERRSE